MGRVDAVIHLAGEPVAQRWNDAVKTKIHDSRVKGTGNLVAGFARCRHKPGVLVAASAMGYYGERGDELLTEESAPGSDFLAKVCVAWEQAALGARDLGLRVATIRIPIALGTEGGALKPMLPAFRLGLGGRLGGGHQWMSWVHLQDLARLFIDAATNPAVSGAVSGASPQPVRNSEFTTALAAVLHRPAVFPVPRLALRLALGEVADSVLQSIRLAPSRAETAGFRFEFPALKQALTDLL
jgi:uncharacterized protein (TIGR01777 family)